MRALIGLGLLAAIGLLFWAWWLPTLLAVIVTIALSICLDWRHIEALLDDKPFIANDATAIAINELHRRAVDGDTHVALHQKYMETLRSKEQFLKQLQGW
jgi:hypothetical protein